MVLPNIVWELVFVIAVAVFFGALLVVFLVYRRPRSSNFLRPLPIVITVMFLVMVLLFFPAYLTRIGAENNGAAESFLLSILASLKLFRADNSYDLFFQSLKTIDSWVKGPYMLFTTSINLLGPVLLIGFILSFIKGLKAYCSYLLGYFREVYIFSKLNEKSFILAQSVLAHYGRQPSGAQTKTKASGRKKKRPLIVFTDVFADNSKTSQKLYQSASDLKCICFKKDILSVRFDIHSRKAKMSFVVIGEDKSENNSQALRLLESPLTKAAVKEKPDYSSRDAAITTLYLFDSSKESELLLDGKQGDMTIRRINRTRQFVHYLLWDYLWDKGTGAQALFDTALDVDGQKRISVLLVGVGKTGTALLKTLSWFCQMDGYEAAIHAIDKDPQLEKRLRFECPETLDEKHNHNLDPDEAVYSIGVHPGINVQNEDFANLANSLAASTTCVFVSLGDDELNVETAVNLRIFFMRAGRKGVGQPLIYAVVHDPERVKKFKNLANYAGDEFCIRLIGDNHDLFSYQMVFDPRLENLAAQAHICWTLSEKENRELENLAEKAEKNKQPTDEERAAAQRARELREGFWGKEYYRHSSIARVIHEKVVDKYGPVSESAIAKLESRRWNAYMRSEGFVYGDERNNLAKQHHLLIPYSAKPKAEQAKDYRGSQLPGFGQ
ncbi:MAG: NAD-binding protein [Eggerthellaceae bacterium]|nr:NAD-binding protein [Eggerthellaceae bacterium]